jgi:hypothetical protein
VPGHRNTKLLLGILLVLWLRPSVAHAQRVAGTVEYRTIEQKPPLDPEGERIATFLAGAPWPKRRGPGQSQDDAVPTDLGWLHHWHETLEAGLQPAQLRAVPPSHPLLMMQPTVLVHGHAPGPAIALPWSRLACPIEAAGMSTQEDAPRPGLTVQLLKVADDGVHLLGIDVWCHQPARKILLRFTRLLVQTDGQGRVQWATGVLLDRPLPLRGDGSVVEPPFFPGYSDAKDARTWLLATPQGWAVQVRIARAAGAKVADSLPRVEMYDGDRTTLGPERALWWLDVHARPKWLLLDGATSGPNARQPLPNRGLWDHGLDENGTLLFQHVGVARPVDDGIAWTQAGLEAWHVRPDASVESVEVPLPRMQRNGVWECAPRLGNLALRCDFMGPEGPEAGLPSAVDLLWTPGKGLVPRATDTP